MTSRATSSAGHRHRWRYPCWRGAQPRRARFGSDLPAARLHRRRKARTSTSAQTGMLVRMDNITVQALALPALTQQQPLVGKLRCTTQGTTNRVPAWRMILVNSALRVYPDRSGWSMCKPFLISSESSGPPHFIDLLGCRSLCAAIAGQLIPIQLPIGLSVTWSRSPVAVFRKSSVAAGSPQNA